MSKRRAVRVARIYEDRDPDHGQRALIERIWPRGIRKEGARVGIWLKAVAPSEELREWYNHQPERLDEFASRREAELDGKPALDELRLLCKRGVVTVVTSSRNRDGSNAAVLAKLMKGG
jgi:uncharacterized protein YeaO (DUF488 family)